MEWQRPDFTSLITAPITATIVLLALSLISRRRPFLWFLSIVVVVLSLQAVRNVPFAVLLLFPVVGSAAAGRWKLASRVKDSALTLPTAVGVGMVVVVTAALLMVAGMRGATMSGWNPSDDDYPAGGAAFLAAEHPGARLFNEYEWGGYLIDRLYPVVPVFVDGREEFYGSEILGDYVSIWKVKPDWDAVLSRYGAEVVMIPGDSDLAGALRSSGSWREEVTGPIEAVFARR